MMSKTQKLKYKINRYLRLISEIENMQLAIGRIENKLNNLNQYKMADANIEFKVNSQWGEDGVIQYLISKIQIPNKVFIEFGVESYVEANTIFLMKNNYWSGLVIDGSETNINNIKYSDFYWKYNIQALCAFITAENINELILSADIRGDIGLLSIDIDGNDYWVWDAINCISPRIVICEYNSLYGATQAITIPYEEDFVRGANHTRLHYGASISAFVNLASKKNYSLVFGNASGNNLFFVRNDCMDNLEKRSIQYVYREQCFREARKKNGELDALSFDQRLSLLKGCPAYDIYENKLIEL